MPTSRRLLTLAILLSATACDGNSTGPDASQRFSVRYEAVGTFDDCTFFYITRRDDVAANEENEGGESLSEEGSLPWSHSFDVTVTRARPFNALVSAVCSSSAERQVTATVFIDGNEVDRQTLTGRNVNAQAEGALTLGG